MVFQKRSDYGFNGCWAPTMPRVPRSAKGKRSARRKVEDKQMYAFDLLVAVAGKLLLERECSMKPSDVNGLLSPTAKGRVIKQEQLEEKKLIKDEAFDQGSCSESTFDSKFSSQRQGNCVQKEQPYTPTSDPIVVEPDVSIEDVKLGGLHIMHNLGTSPEKFGNRTSSCGYAESCEGQVGTAVKTLHQAEWQINGHLIDEDATNIRSEDPMDLDSKHTVSRSSHSSVGVPPCGDHNRSNAFLTKSRKHVELAVDRDDDENASACTHTNSMTPRAGRLHRVGDRRIRKLLACKHWKTAPIVSRNGELSNTDVEMKPVFRGRKLCCTRQRTQSSFKRRKVHERSAISASENSFSFKSIGNLSEKDLKVATSNSCAAFCGVNGVSSSLTGQRPSYESDDFHVKLNIKSFKVPELFIEIPETSTVASLKRTVMETVTAVLGGGMHVGVLFQGRKVRDDSKTLSQVGISHGDKLDGLGFTLEPNPKPAPPPVGSPEVLHPLPCSAAEPLTRLPSVAPTTDPQTSAAIPEAPLNHPVVNILESDHDSVQSPVEANSRALVPAPPMSVEALSVVPFRKSKRPELVQRRIRRPFSVAEVEALVQAVEKLGTGRWRDVKIRSFDNAKHRTYVDLKDKWKTLVHTARISPQQRRGEPVPQELLDRVLAAHAYWSQQQAKLQAKPLKAAACLPAPLI